MSAAAALGSPRNHVVGTGWGQGLRHDMAGGSSRKEDKFKHSLYLAQ